MSGHVIDLARPCETTTSWNGPISFLLLSEVNTWGINTTWAGVDTTLGQLREKAVPMSCDVASHLGLEMAG